MSRAGVCIGAGPGLASGAPPIGGVSAYSGDDDETMRPGRSRNREPDAEGNDRVLSVLDTTDFDELWLFAVDTGDGLSKTDCEGKIGRAHV